MVTDQHCRHHGPSSAAEAVRHRHGDATEASEHRRQCALASADRKSRALVPNDDADTWCPVPNPPTADNRLLSTGFHEHSRETMTNSVCNSGQDSQGPPGPATDLRTDGQVRGSSRESFRQAPRRLGDAHLHRGTCLPRPRPAVRRGQLRNATRVPRRDPGRLPRRAARRRLGLVEHLDGGRRGVLSARSWPGSPFPPTSGRLGCSPGTGEPPATAAGVRRGQFGLSDLAALLATCHARLGPATLRTDRLAGRGRDNDTQDSPRVRGANNGVVREVLDSAHA